MHASNKAVSEDERSGGFSRRPLYCGRAGSDVIGCRLPTGCVFIYMLQTRVTLTAFPIATPRGRSSKSHEGESFAHKNNVLTRDCDIYCECARGCDVSTCAAGNKRIGSESARRETDRPVTDPGRSRGKSDDSDHWPVNRCISTQYVVLCLYY